MSGVGKLFFSYCFHSLSKSLKPFGMPWPILIVCSGNLGHVKILVGSIGIPRSCPSLDIIREKPVTFR